jgi:hypothetical protein
MPDAVPLISIRQELEQFPRLFPAMLHLSDIVDDLRLAIGQLLQEPSGSGSRLAMGQALKIRPGEIPAGDGGSCHFLVPTCQQLADDSKAALAF